MSPALNWALASRASASTTRSEGKIALSCSLVISPSPGALSFWLQRRSLENPTSLRRARDLGGENSRNFRGHRSPDCESILPNNLSMELPMNASSRLCQTRAMTRPSGDNV
jgi:hypothetical protein